MLQGWLTCVGWLPYQVLLGPSFFSFCCLFYFVVDGRKCAVDCVLWQNIKENVKKITKLQITLTIPEINGLNTCKRIRKMLSAKSATHYNYLSRANEYFICPYHIENKE